jgi:replicative DNA helicase
MPWRGMERFNVRLRPGTMAILAAGSSVGKTTFLECCAEFWARQGYQVAFFHLELSHQLMLDRRAARLTGIPMHQIEDGILDARINDALATLYKYPGGINYVHCPGWSASRIATYARQLRNKGRCDVAIVDYLQKMHLAFKPGINKADALGDAVETLKTAAELLEIPMLLASQFNRAAQFSDRKTGDYIRGSGEPHEKGNVVITLDRDILNEDMHDGAGRVVAESGSRSPVLKVRVDKNTSGPIGDTELIMNAARLLVLDAAREELIL